VVGLTELLCVHFFVFSVSSVQLSWKTSRGCGTPVPYTLSMSCQPAMFAYSVPHGPSVVVCALHIPNRAGDGEWARDTGRIARGWQFAVCITLSVPVKRCRGGPWCPYRTVCCGLNRSFANLPCLASGLSLVVRSVSSGFKAFPVAACYGGQRGVRVEL